VIGDLGCDLGREAILAQVFRIGLENDFKEGCGLVGVSMLLTGIKRDCL